MKNIIVVAGATGNLGQRICKALIEKGAEVRAIVRASTDTEKEESLEKTGVIVVIVDFNEIEAIATACKGASCVVSAIAGLGDVIIDLQKKILEGAIKAGVKQFIPSDFCTDYTNLAIGVNRNLDLRREFRNYIDSTTIQATSIFNGCFADILKYNTPILNLKDKSIGYWGEKADWLLDFTTMDDTATFTAEVALDFNAPRDLQIASFQVSPNDILSEMEEITKYDYKVLQLSSMEDFAVHIKKQRATDPAGENELYAKFQQNQYIYCMFVTHHNTLANSRYEELHWTSSHEYLKTFAK